MPPTRDGLDHLLRFLVAYRLLLYLGALVAMSLPLGLAWLFGVELEAPARTTVVAVSFGVILATYFAERRVGLDHVDPRTGNAAESYSTRMQVSVLLAVVGVAVGTYFVLDARPLVGLLFLTGAVLFFQLASRSTTETEEGDR